MKQKEVLTARKIYVFLIFGLSLVLSYSFLRSNYLIALVCLPLITILICKFVGGYSWFWVINMTIAVYCPFIMWSGIAVLMDKYSIDGLANSIATSIAVLSGVPFIIFQFKKKSFWVVPVYLVILLPVLMLYMFGFVCSYFGDCL